GEDVQGGDRLDKYISDKLRLFSRSQIKRRVVRVLVNGLESKLSRKIKTGDHLEILYTEPPSPDVRPEAIELDILYEDANVAVINKPQGMVVHPGKGRHSGTLVNALLFRCEGMAARFPEEYLRPGIVHRLDKDTSGVIITARNIETHNFLARQFSKRRIRKTYLAIVKGSPPHSRGIIETQIKRNPYHRKRFTACQAGGRVAVTAYKVLRSFPGYSFIALRPNTGRTHQLRVHALHMGCPVLGDPIYSRRDRVFPEATLMLHAYKLEVVLPPLHSGEPSNGVYGQFRRKTFKAPVPSRFKEILGRLARPG
ncbi:MAG TPA: RluA family pseudouridine synthase, partial [Spirochaetia bacterium]|nr:RluA family pseudouridine synthase [Spirochaetia bacterium]